MKIYVLLTISVAAFVVFATLPANARYEIIRWKGGYCEIVDQRSPIKPWGNDFKRGKRTFETFGQATVARAKLIVARECSG
jgi:hypothetical protein